MPVGNGGKFTPEARAIYTLVHEMQRLSFEAIRPGVHWDTIQLICHQTLVRGFQKLGIFKTPNSPGSGSWNSEEAIVASGVSAAFFPHGVGHSLGMDVHDVPSASKPLVNPTIKQGQEVGHPDFYTYLRLRLPLEVGMVVVSTHFPTVVTVESGSYTCAQNRPSSRESISHPIYWRRFGDPNTSILMSSRDMRVLGVSGSKMLSPSLEAVTTTSPPSGVTSGGSRGFVLVNCKVVITCQLEIPRTPVLWWDKCVELTPVIHRAPKIVQCSSVLPPASLRRGQPIWPATG